MEKKLEKKLTRAERNRKLLPPELLAELLETKTRAQIAKDYGLQSYEVANLINYYRRKGFEIPQPKTRKQIEAANVQEVAKTEAAITVKQEQKPKSEATVTELDKERETKSEEPKQECNCVKDNAILEELDDLWDEIERLKKITAAVQNFAYKHRHQVGAGHYSEWGVAD